MSFEDTGRKPQRRPEMGRGKMTDPLGRSKRFPLRKKIGKFVLGEKEVAFVQKLKLSFTILSSSKNSKKKRCVFQEELKTTEEVRKSLNLS